MNKKIRLVILLLLSQPVLQAQHFSLGSVTGYPFPSELTASGSKLAVAINERGKRNIYAGEAPAFDLKKITTFDSDEGQELTGVSVSPDGKWVVYVRGGDHGAFDETIPRNPASSPATPKIEVFSVPFDGGRPVLLDEGDNAVISPNSDKVAFVKKDEVWVRAIDGSAPAKRLFYARGNNHSISWSPDGKHLLFVCSRDHHSFVGIFSDSASPIKWMAPAFTRDQSPRWSLDGKQIVFIRREVTGGMPDSLTVLKHEPWSVWTGDVTTLTAKRIWTAPKTLRGSVPGTQGGFNLHWAAGGKIIFVSYEDGWPHLYAVPSEGGTAVLLTKGKYMVEHVRLSPDKKWIVASANTGSDSNDLHRRHIIKLAVDKPGVEVMTDGMGIETQPVVVGKNAVIAMISATAQRPGTVGFMPFDGGKIVLPGSKLLPHDFPVSKLVEPKAVQFRSEDGVTVHGQIFDAGKTNGKKPAVVFVHGGPERQMLLGWHYGDYYSNTYALNQYLAASGFVVLSVNYRLGIGYGFEFQNAPRTWIYGAEEYNDIKAAGKWLKSLPQVDGERIGIYGGSYGGFLTALALGKDSKIFKAGVDIHGVHNMMNYWPDVNGEQAPDADLARKLVWQSSPVAWLDNWTSPVLLIHGDDDGNVSFDETLDLVKRFQKKGFDFESLAIPDETHHWMKYSNQLRVDAAIADFLKRKLHYTTDSRKTMDNKKLRKEIETIFSDHPQAEFAVAFKDLSSGEQFFINERRSFHAASTMKTPVLIETFKQAAAGKLSLSDSVSIKNRFSSIVDASAYSLDSTDDSEKDLYSKLGSKLPLEDLLRRMITMSSNLATNLVIELVGAENIMATMKSMGAKDIKVLRGVEDNKAYEKGLNNSTTAYDLMLIFDKMASGQIVDQQSCKAMIGILMDQHFRGIIPAKLPPEVRSATKSGWITAVCHDSGIVFLPDGRKYVLALLSKGISDQKLAEETLANISRLIYDHLNHF